MICDRSGPFRAIADGNPMLEPFSLKLEHNRTASILQGRYVLWTDGHFVGVHVTDRSNFVVFNGDNSYTAASQDDVTGTLPCIWYRLSPLTSAGSPSAGTVPILTAEQLGRIEANRTAALKRKWSRSRSDTASAVRDGGHADARDAGLSGLIRPSPPPTWAHPDIPATPVNFVAFDVVLPTMTFLSTLHMHPRDASVRLVPGSHTYIVGGIPMLISVTGLIHAFAEEFDPDTVAARMINGSNWPRPGYLRETVNPSTLSRLREHPVGARLADLLCSPDRDETAICELAKNWACTSCDARSIMLDVTLTRDAIKQKWEENRVTAANKGTWMHFCFEAWLNGCDVPQDSPEVTLFLEVTRAMKGLTAYRTEWVIFGNDEQLAGCIDFVATNASSNLVLFDWKRTSKIRTKYSNPWRNMLEPLTHLEDCAGVHYRLQLNIYRYLLQKYYGKKVAGMWVVCTHPENEGGAFLDRVPVMSEEVDAIMERQRRRAAESAAMMANDPVWLDPPGGMDSQASQDFESMLALEESFLDDSLPGPRVDPAVADEPPVEPATEEAGGVGRINHPAVPLFDASSAATVCRPEASQVFAAFDPAGGQGTQGACVAPDLMEGTEEGVGPEELPTDLTRDVDSGSHCKRRRFQKGASTSNADFRELFDCCAHAVASSLDVIKPEVVGNPTGIVNRTQALTAFIRGAHPDWSEAQTRLVCAALSIYKMRLVDMFLREHVLLLWIIEGGRYMRAHDGTCFFYHDDGAFQTYRGVPPESTFSRVKAFLLELEGLFRLLPRDVKRTDDELMVAISSSMENHASYQDYLHRCVDAAIFNMGDRRQPKVRARSREEGDDCEEQKQRKPPCIGIFSLRVH